MNWLDAKAYDFGAAFGRVLFPLFRKRARLAVENVIKAGITSDPVEARRIARVSFGHLAGHICEALRVPHVVTQENWREHIDVTGADPEVVRLLLDPPTEPILLVSSHHGVWEAATNVLSMVRPMIAIARVMNNRLVAGWMKNHHFRGPVTVIDKNHGFTPTVIRDWERDNAAMTILMDQHTARGKILSFLGRPAYTFTSAARLAIRTGHPVVIGSFVRVGPYRYRLVGTAPLRFTKTDDLAAVTQKMNDRLSEAIRLYPEQYLWAHKRWRVGD